MIGSEHEEVLDALDSFDTDPIVFFVDELMDKVENKRPRASRLLDIGTEDGNDSVDVLTYYLVRREVTADIGMVERASIWLMGLK